MTKTIEINIPNELWKDIDSFISEEKMTVNEFIYWVLGEKIGKLKNESLIDKFKHEHSNLEENNIKTYSPKQLLRASDVARCLEVSKPEAYKLIQEKELPVIKIGRLVRVKYEDLEKFIENNRR